MQYTTEQLLAFTRDFIDFFGAIPEWRWCCGDYHRGGNSCALGHIENAFFERGSATAYDKIYAVFNIIEIGILPVRINDGDDSRYPQPTPKLRILAALTDVKNILEARLPRKDITLELAVLPAEEKLDLINNKNKEYGTQLHNG